jgi:hypothetical protein
MEGTSIALVHFGLSSPLIDWSAQSASLKLAFSMHANNGPDKLHSQLYQRD